eukprot:8835372-Pyramimonas_sp.AAC.1
MSCLRSVDPWIANGTTRQDGWLRNHPHPHRSPPPRHQLLSLPHPLHAPPVVPCVRCRAGPDVARWRSAGRMSESSRRHQRLALGSSVDLR